MDQPGPRPGPRPRPLIISHPELQAPWRRAFAFALTLAAWAVWLLLLFPLLWMSAERYGLSLRPLEYFVLFDSKKMGQVLDFFPLALLLALGGLGLLFASGLLLKLLRATREAPLVRGDLHRTVMDTSVDPAELATWRSARVVQVEHGANGRVKDVRVVLPADT